MFYAGLARDQREVELALALAGRVFSPTITDLDLVAEQKRFLVLEHPGVLKDSVIVVSLAGQGVVGAAFLIDRIFPHGPALIGGTFISSVCIDENVRGRGYSRALMSAAIKACSDRGAAIALVIARRAADHFYARFGFWGLSQYSKLTVDVAAIFDMPVSASMRLRPASSADLPSCAALYDLSYRESFGHCFRDAGAWHHILKKLSHMQVRLSVIEMAGSIIGYAVHAGDGNIYELASNRTVEAQAVLSLFACSNPGVSLSLHVSPSHPIVPALGGLDITLSARECPFGGHMVRVIDPVQLAAAAARRIEQRASSFNLAPGTESVDGLHLTWDGQAAHVRLDGHINSLASVRRLLGAAYVSSPGETSRFDPSVSFNILLADQA